MMNKGLEFIEAKWLFDMPNEDIEIVVHRESVVHSAIVYQDNSMIAQLGVPDMRIPIQYALTYPEREPSPVKELSLTDSENLHSLNRIMILLNVSMFAKKLLNSVGFIPPLQTAQTKKAKTFLKR